jgi:prepilin-type N-terminal cleavage/methylation domain-containing protein
MRETPNHTSRTGMSLVELLVVVAIVGLLAVTVIPNLANTAESRGTREAARTLQSFIAKSHSRAIGRPRWSGFLMQPIPGSYGCSDVFLADVPEPYRGDTVDATLKITGSSAATRTLSAPTASVIASLNNAALGFGGGDLVRFNNNDPYFQIATTTNAIQATSIRIWHRGMSPIDYTTATIGEMAGYEPRNTPWPPSDTDLTFEILRKPQLVGVPFTLENRLVDLRWSGFGPRRTVRNQNMYRRLVPSSQNPSSYDPANYASDLACVVTSVVFDGTGRLRQICLGDIRFPVNGPVFLLVGRADRVGQPYAPLNAQDDSLGANWQYADSFWVGIDPLTGVARVAECVPDRPPFASTLVQQHQRLIASQAWIRAALSTDGR